MNLELVTIIIPVFNGEKYIAKCLGSVLTQTYQELEIIIIDDGSTDNTVNVVKKIISGDKRVQLISQENAGVSSARNKGLEIATGKYVAFIDADDWVDREYISALVKRIKADNADISVCSFATEYEEGVKEKNYIKISKDAVVNTKNDIYKYVADGANWIYVVWGKVFRRGILDGIEFNQQSYCEDAKFMRDVIKRVNVIALTNLELYHYYMNCASVTHDINRQFEYDYSLLQVTYKYWLDAKKHIFENLLSEIEWVIMICWISVLCGNVYSTSKPELIINMLKKKELNTCVYYNEICDIYNDIKSFKSRRMKNLVGKSVCHLIARTGGLL